MRIDTVTGQDKLDPRQAPYWHKVGNGQHVGFRKTKAGTSWHARAYDAATKTQPRKALGDFSHLSPGDRFSAAVAAAGAWFDHLRRGGSRDVITVRDACSAYVDHLRDTKGEAAAEDAKARYERYVYPDRIADVSLPKMTRAHVEGWRKRLATTPTKPAKRGPRCRVKTPQPPPAPRSEATTNRDIVPVRAALNYALDHGHVANDHAWRVALRPAKNVNRRRDIYLTPDQRRALLAELPEDLAAFARGLCSLPLRPGALAALTVADYDKGSGSLRILADKAGAGRTLLLPPSLLDLLRGQTRNKLPAAPLFARADGSAWKKEHWKGPIRRAVAAAGLPPGTVAYTLRHSAITDLVSAGLDLFTVAAMSGTSVRMIESHYGHLQQDRARDALAGLAL